MRFAFRSSALASIAAIAATNDLRMEELSAVQRQEKLDTFAADFTRRMDAADAGKPAKPAAGESTAEVAETDTDAHQEVDEESTEEESTATESGADETEVDDVEETGADEVEEETEEETEHEEEEELDEDFKTAAARAKLPTSLDDIPEAARPLVKKRLKEVEAGFTRAMMEARSYRAEERYRKEHPADFIAEMLAADPDLEAQVSAELEKRGDETYSEARKIIERDRRKQAAEAVETEQTSEARREARIGEVESLASKACTKFGIPFGRAVESAIANAIITSETGDIDNAEVSEIVKSIAKELGAVSRKERIDNGKKLVQDKTRDRAAAPKIRPGTGRGVPPAKPGKSKLTLEQKIAATVEKIFPGAE